MSTKTITVSVQLKESSQPIVHNDVINTYQKGDIFVIYTDNEKSYKYPIANVWRIVEDYGYHGREIMDIDESTANNAIVY